MWLQARAFKSLLICRTAKHEKFTLHSTFNCFRRYMENTGSLSLHILEISTYDLHDITYTPCCHAMTVAMSKESNCGKYAHSVKYMKLHIPWPALWHCYHCDKIRVMALYDTLKVEMSREHWDRLAPVYFVFLTHWDCIYFTKFS